MSHTPSEHGAGDPLGKLRRRKVVQWSILYAAGAWGLLQGLAYVTDTFHWPEKIQQLSTLALVIGLPVVVVLSWYHGDRGEQRVGRTELSILSLLLVLGGGVLWLYQRNGETPTPVAATAVAPGPAAETTTADPGPSIAVLPFDNRSRLEDDAYFVDGIHDDILTQLSKISALKVISRTSMEQFRDTKLPIKAIAAQLGVKSLLEGGVQRAGDRVRINVQLIDAGTDAHLWAETYDRELTAENIFAIQTELATAIAGALKTALTPAEQARARVVPTRNLAAWEAYQLGKQRLAKRTTGSLVESEKYFRKAVELDPDFAGAHAGLATAISLLPFYSGAPKLDAFDRAQAEVDTALRLDPGHSEAWTASAMNAYHREDYARAEPLFQRAIELDPNNAMAFKWYGQLLLDTLRFDEGQRTMERAAELDPLSAIIQVNLADALRFQGRFPEAATHLRRAIEIDPSSPMGYGTLAELYARAFNRYADAVPLAQKAVALDPGGPWWSALVFLYRDLGDDTRANATIEDASTRWADAPDVQILTATARMFQHDDAGMVRHALRSLGSDPRSWVALLLLRNADLKRGRNGDALARYQKAYPELFEADVPSLEPSNVNVAVDLALVLLEHGDEARARVLLDSAAQHIAKTPQLGWAGYWIVGVQIHALRGETAEALAALRAAQKSGWRGPYWRYYRDFDPALASIRNEPEFEAVFGDIERDMARQRAELAGRPKDAALDVAAARPGAETSAGNR